MEAMDFFRMTEGRWRSQRVTHHLAMRRTELGELQINATVLPADAPKVAAICAMHDIDAATAIGGIDINWQGFMAWDADKGQGGATVMVLVPDQENAKSGLLLREKGYAETSPVVGRYLVDDQDGLVLSTEYETMSSVERFSFLSSTLRFRTSTVLGLSNTASFCVETLIPDGEEDMPPAQALPSNLPACSYSALGW
ncbi:MAG: phycobiliprotein lyase [Cyanobacteria bacterium]|nr:phycobiliprotein lyase [Cyanobacteriota bacterium]